MSFGHFALIAIIVGWVAYWAVVFDYRAYKYTQERKRFRFFNQFEHVGQERAHAALAERLKAEAEQAQVRG